jgi:putative nucleotidyltransferase with HDIG domain
MSRTFDSRLNDLDALPAAIVDRALKLVDAEDGVLFLVEQDGKTCTRAAVAGQIHADLPVSCGIDEGFPSAVLAAGKARLEPGLSDQPDAECSTIAVPLRLEGATLGALFVSDPRPGRGFNDDDLRLLDLYADSAATALANARRYTEANARAVELMQLNEMANALRTESEIDRLTYLVGGMLDKLIDFEVGGIVLLGREERGHVIVHGDCGADDLAELLSEVTGMDIPGDFVDRCAVVGDKAPWQLKPAEGAKWNHLTANVSTMRPEAGWLFVASRDPHAFDEADLRLLDAQAGHVSAALEKTRVTAGLQADLSRVVRALSALVDAAERVPAGHAQRVMDHAIAIGEEMALPVGDLECLRFAGLLHDIGTLGLPEEIVLKPSSLSGEEEARMRRHAEVGATLVEQMDFLGAVAPVVMHHHERWDGYGYPAGLEGDEIPLLARVLAVADAWDSMTSDRAHRKALPLGTARRELAHGAGTQFDPAVVEAFLVVLDRGTLHAATGAFADDAAGPHLPA